MEKEKEAYEIKIFTTEYCRAWYIKLNWTNKRVNYEKNKQKEKNACKTFVTLRDLAWHTMLQRRNVNTFQMLQS